MNDFYTPEQVAQVAAVMVADELALAGLVDRSLDFRQGSGGTLLVPIPSALVAHDRDVDDITTDLVMDSLAEDTVALSGLVHAYSGVPLSEGDLSLNLTDFSRQVLKPQTAAIVDRCEAEVERVFAEVAPSSIAFDPAAPTATFTALRRELRDRGVDTGAGGIYAVVGGNVADAILDSGALDAAQTGDASALRRGVIGKVRGLEIVESSRVGADEIVAFHRDGVSLAVQAPQVPLGAAFGSVVTESGFSLRYLRDYDSSKAADRSLVSTFVKGFVFPSRKIVRNYATGEATIVDTGARIVKVDTA